MKKIIIPVAIVAVCASFAAPTFAFGWGNPFCPAPNANTGNHVIDHVASNCANASCIAAGNSACPGYVDANGDGICDNYTAYVNAGGAPAPAPAPAVLTTDTAAPAANTANAAIATAPAPTAATRAACYVDNNGDGICDNYAHHDASSNCIGRNPGTSNSNSNSGSSNTPTPSATPTPAPAPPAAAAPAPSTSTSNTNHHYEGSNNNTQYSHNNRHSNGHH